MKLWTINRIIRHFGFVLVVETDDSTGFRETRLYFCSLKRYLNRTKK